MINQISSRPTNRLAQEKSPYLLQHRFNPVDWYPWGEMAFAKARGENKPVFLSIGYSTCHWCHVMERESFENEAVADFLKQHFVSIKLDREERPDVDHVYMTFVQATTGQGGWPLNVFLTPALQPFFGGTYFPPEGNAARTGFLTVLRQIAQLWASRQNDLVASAAKLHGQLQSLATAGASQHAAASREVIGSAITQFKAEYDPEHGGFGHAPKFPRVCQPTLMLEHAFRAQDDEAKQMVLRTCDGMAAGGIHDQLGGGFARYSVDAAWLVPHFEKMLYDNAQLTSLYLDAYLVSGVPHYAAVARDILHYVARDMTSPEGGFYSAEDADSEGKEGKFYCWTRAEMAAVLSEDEFRVASRYFGVTERGNFVDHSDPDPLPGLNVLSIVHPQLGPGEEAQLSSAKEKLLAVRAGRVRPQRDDKILTSWNGLMLGAFARAYAILGEEAYRRAAERNLAFLQARVWDAGSKTLYPRWREGERAEAQLLEAYAFLLSGVLDWYEATLATAALEFAVALAEALLDRFFDASDGGFWQSPATAADLILRLKPDYDGAEPAGNSVAVLALAKLALICDRADFRQAADRSLDYFGGRLARLPHALPYLLRAVEFRNEEPQRVVLAGEPTLPALRTLLHAVHSVYNPNRVVLGTVGPVEPFARTLPEQGGQPTAYVCTGTACQSPVHDAEALRDQLQTAR